MDLKYIVYITVNQCNGKFYIGVHKTNPEIFDGYIGCSLYSTPTKRSSIAFHNAVRKYGYSNFKRTTIRIFDTAEEAFNLEKELVTETLIRSKYCYNMVPGGLGGGNFVQQKKVYKFDLNGNFLRSFKCLRDCAIDLNIDSNIKNTMAAIKNCCLGSTHSAFNFFWSYDKKFVKYDNARFKKISQFLTNGKFVRSYGSVAEAARELNLTSIDQAIRKKFLCGGFQ